MTRTVRVFISSTWKDLQPEREAVERALRRVCDAGVVAMEYFGSRPETTREVSLAEVDRSDIYVGIIAHRYGSGITQAEYERARGQGVPLLFYIKSNEVPVLPDHIEPTQQGRRRLESFKRMVMGRHVVQSFSNPDQLATLVVADLHRELADYPRAVRNPFSWRGGITEADAFFDRSNELGRLRAYISSRQSCQVVGPSRIGKTSLLLQLQRKVTEWAPNNVIAYVNLQDPRCETVVGWMERAGHEFGWPQVTSDSFDFYENIEAMIHQGQQPILCLDDFEALMARRGEFDRDFLHMLRSLAQAGLVIITSSRARLSTLTDHLDPSSPFYNVMAPLEVGVFSGEDAERFVRLSRPGLPAFTSVEQATILGLARNHPLALQIACFHVLNVGRAPARLSAALESATAEMAAYLSAW